MECAIALRGGLGGVSMSGFSGNASSLLFTDILLGVRAMPFAGLGPVWVEDVSLRWTNVWLDSLKYSLPQRSPRRYQYQIRSGFDGHPSRVVTPPKKALQPMLGQVHH